MTVDVSRTGYQMELDAILAVVIGGTSLAGGRFYIGGAVDRRRSSSRRWTRPIVFLGIPASATPAFKAVVIVALCLLQSQRVRPLFGRRRTPARRRTSPPEPPSRPRKELGVSTMTAIRPRDRSPSTPWQQADPLAARQPVDAPDRWRPS